VQWIRPGEAIVFRKLVTLALLTAGGMALKSKVQKTTGSGGRMSTATDSIEVNVPMAPETTQASEPVLA